MVRGLVLAGCKGSRLRPLTLGLPKHFVSPLGKAMIEHPIQHLVDAGIRNTGVVGCLSHLIKEYPVMALGMERGSYILSSLRGCVLHMLFI